MLFRGHMVLRRLKALQVTSESTWLRLQQETWCSLHTWDATSFIITSARLLLIEAFDIPVSFSFKGKDITAFFYLRRPPASQMPTMGNRYDMLISFIDCKKDKSHKSQFIISTTLLRQRVKAPDYKVLSFLWFQFVSDDGHCRDMTIMRHLSLTCVTTFLSCSTFEIRIRHIFYLYYWWTYNFEDFRYLKFLFWPILDSDQALMMI